eukprot:CAMPEP_0185768044 /NCGR_PEP_ID=MMETSP1174-20130828/46896_1 /TAXON_ID=35687 /ORGANISM="Dictyocha speculum, Strain CCMP1381" /LENGTH=93 /DNA_ID=CAMNT_0028452521 /DNA_START=418 /DNA_END=697 /DNA_ORIENTATION=-
MCFGDCPGGINPAIWWGGMEAERCKNQAAVGETAAAAAHRLSEGVETAPPPALLLEDDETPAAAAAAAAAHRLSEAAETLRPLVLPGVGTETA